MGNAGTEEVKSTWQIIHGLLISVVWEQILSTLIILGFVVLSGRLVRTKIDRVTALSIAVAGSFVLWPHIFGLFLDVSDPNDFPFHWPDVQSPSRWPNLMMIGLFFLPALLNGYSIFLVFVAFFIWLLSRDAALLSSSGARRALICVLPCAWLLDCFYTGSS